MSLKETYEAEVANCTDGEPLTLTIGYRDGSVIIQLANQDATSLLCCTMEPEFVADVTKGLTTAASGAASK